MDDLFTYLDVLVATSGIFYNKLKSHHWSMTGLVAVPFYHEWIDDQAEIVEDFTDLMAEHIRIMSASHGQQRFPVSTTAEWVTLSPITELAGQQMPLMERIQMLYDDYITYRNLLQQGLDMTTLLDQQDLNGKIQQHQIDIGKAIWYTLSQMVNGGDG